MSRSSLLFLIASFLLSLSSVAQDGKERSDSAVFIARSDSVWRYKNSDPDTALVLAKKNIGTAEEFDGHRFHSRAYRELGAVLMVMGSYEKSLRKIRESVKIGRKANDSADIASGYRNIGLVYSRMSRFDSALHYYEDALDIAQALNDTSNIIGLYNNIGNIHRIRSNLIEGMECYHRALNLLDSIDEERKDRGTIYGNLGVIQKRRGSYDKALERYKEARAVFRKEEDRARVAMTDLSIGQILQKKGDSLQGLKRFRKAYRNFRDRGDIRREGVALLNISGHFAIRGMLDSADRYAEKGLDVARQLDAKTLLLSALDKKAEVLQRKGEAAQAKELALQGLEMARTLESLKWRKAFLEIAHLSSRDMGRYEEAYRYQDAWYDLKDSLKSEERAEKLTRMEMRYQFEKEQMKDSIEHAKEMRLKDMKVKKKEAEIERKQTVQNFLVGGGLILLLFAFLIYDRFRVARKRKSEVEEKKQEVDLAFAQLHEKNSELENSIHYASRIQSAILTGDEVFGRVLDEHFLFFKPKEAVSGDFYWAYGDERYAIWLAADCTGHGVPGAFMSMIGNRLFNEVVVEQGERDPGAIFEKVRSGIIEALEQGGQEETNDGMDAALCVFDRKRKKMHFAGAQNPLYIVQPAENEPPVEGHVIEEGGQRLIEVKGDRSPLGRDPYKREAFRTISFKIEGSESFYTFSDGFPDQFGGTKGKKYRYKPFKRLILSLQDRSLKEQGRAMEKEFEEWKKDREQVDDVLVIGVEPFASWKNG